MVHGARVLIDSEGKPTKYIDRLIFESLELWLRMLAENQIVQSTVMVRRSVYDKVGFYDESAAIGEDYEMWLRIIRSCEASYIPYPLVTYRDHDQNSTFRQGEERQSADLRRIRKKMLQLNLDQEFEKYLVLSKSDELKQLLLARAYAARAEGSLRWGMISDALRDIETACSHTPDILNI